MGGALGDVQAGRDVAQSRAGSWAMHSSTRAWLVRKLHSGTLRKLVHFVSGNTLLAFGSGVAWRQAPRADPSQREPDLPIRAIAMAVLALGDAAGCDEAVDTPTGDTR